MAQENYKRQFPPDGDEGIMKIGKDRVRDAEDLPDTQAEVIELFPQRVQETKRETKYLLDNIAGMTAALSSSSNFEDEDTAPLAHLVESHKTKVGEVKKRLEKLEARLVIIDESDPEREKILAMVDRGLEEIKKMLPEAEGKEKEKMEWVVKAVEHARDNAYDNRGHYLVTDHDGKKQLEGIPLDYMIEVLENAKGSQNEGLEVAKSFDIFSKNMELRAVKDELVYLNKARQNSKEIEGVYRAVLGLSAVPGAPAFLSRLRGRPDIKAAFDFGKGTNYKGQLEAAHDLIEFLAREAEGKIKNLESIKKRVETKRRPNNTIESLLKNLRKYSKSYRALHGEPTEGRKKTEAHNVYGDFEKTGTPEGDWEVAGRRLKDRLELNIPKVVIEDVEPVSPTPEPVPPEPIPPTPEPIPPEPIPPPPEKIRKPTTKERPPKRIIDIPLKIMREVVGLHDVGKQVTEAIVSGDKASGRVLVHEMFDDLPLDLQDDLGRELWDLGYTFAEFEKKWKGELFEKVYEQIELTVHQEVKNRVAQSVTWWDRTKAGWKGTLKKVGMSLGVGVALASGVGAIAGAGAGIFAAITGGGMLREYLNDRALKKQGKGILTEDEAEKLANVERVKQKRTPEMLAALNKEIAGNVGGTVGQSIRELTSGGNKGVNARLMRENILIKNAAELKANGELGDAQAANVEALLCGNEARHDTLVHAADKTNDPNILNPITKRMKAKVWNFFGIGLKNGENEHVVEKIVRYGKYAAIGGSTLAAPGWTRITLASKAGGAVGYEVGKAWDQKTQEKSVRSAINGLMNETEDMLSVFDGGMKFHVNVEKLTKNIQVLDGHLKMGTLDGQPVQKLNAEAMLREGHRILEKILVGKMDGTLEFLSHYRMAVDKQAQEDLDRITKKTGKWRRWAGAAIGLIGGAAIGWLMSGKEEPKGTGKPEEHIKRGPEGEQPVHRGRHGIEETASPYPRPLESETHMPRAGIEIGTPPVDDSHLFPVGGRGLWGVEERFAKAIDLIHNTDKLLIRHPEWAHFSPSERVAKWLSEQNVLASAEVQHMHHVAGGGLYDSRLGKGSMGQGLFASDSYPEVHLRPDLGHITPLRPPLFRPSP